VEIVFNVDIKLQNLCVGGNVSNFYLWCVCVCLLSKTPILGTIKGKLPRKPPLKVEKGEVLPLKPTLINV